MFPILPVQVRRIILFPVSSTNMATAWTKLKVKFECDAIVSIREIHERMCQVYSIGYTGLFSDDHTYALLQTNDIKVRMSPNKVRKICARFGDVVSVEPFSCLAGKLIEEIGTFRKAGRRWPAISKKPKHTPAQPGSNDAQPSPAKHTTGTSTPKEATPKVPKHTPVQQKDFCEEEDPVFLPVYTGFGGDWKVVSWNRATKKAKRRDCAKFREQVLDGQDHKCNYCACNVSFGHYSNADVDHIIPLNAGGEQALSNVHVLCTPCHRRKTGLESQRFTTTLGAIMSAAYRPSERQDVGEVGSEE